jgi:hypothetical protein
MYPPVPSHLTGVVIVTSPTITASVSPALWVKNPSIGQLRGVTLPELLRGLSEPSRTTLEGR